LVRRFRTHLSYANVMATVALFVALGGSSYAAFALPKNSVGSRQLKTHAVTPKKVARSTVALFKGKKGDRGPMGPPGIQGPTGGQGPTGPSNAYYATVTSGAPSVAVPAGDYAVSGDDSLGCSASCGVSCRIQLDGKNAGPFTVADTGSEAGEMSLADSASLHLTSPGTITNTCGFSSGIGTQESRSVTAIKVGSISP
jgi:hypothetical protein